MFEWLDRRPGPGVGSRGRENRVGSGGGRATLAPSGASGKPLAEINLQKAHTVGLPKMT